MSEPGKPLCFALVPFGSKADGSGRTLSVASSRPDYWDYATLLELAILAEGRGRANDALANASPLAAETWMAESTAVNLRLIREARESRGEAVDWITEIEAELSGLVKQEKSQ